MQQGLHKALVGSFEIGLPCRLFNASLGKTLAAQDQGFVAAVDKQYGVAVKQRTQKRRHPALFLGLIDLQHLLLQKVNDGSSGRRRCHQRADGLNDAFVDSDGINHAVHENDTAANTCYGKGLKAMQLDGFILSKNLLYRSDIFFQYRRYRFLQSRSPHLP